ncbi:hypothetical protein ASPCAL10047 [Aspergillus calidoustus]|uniref:Uncharacterized protein n=1 Tax=Aspergillus calidoustus TaxID=454130 RepID=A0A0U5G7H5_ASPCI|nr:hypothetical protein ASPCAL10047 [Aspergillus calidoustus]
MKFHKVNPAGAAYPVCVICGSPILESKYPDYNDREDWGQKTRNRRGRCAYTSTADVEATDLSDDPARWAKWYRAIIFHPKTKGAHLSGLARGAHPDYAPVVPTDSNKARLSGRPKHDNDWNTEFYPADIFYKRALIKDKRYGFAIHAHCWLLLTRTIDLATIERNLEVFCLAVRLLWNFEGRAPYWGRTLTHNPSNRCLDQGTFGRRKIKMVGVFCNPDRPAEWPLYARHTSGSPYHIPKIHALITQATQSAGKCSNQARPRRQQRPQPTQPIATRLPLDIALEIIDVIYHSDAPTFARAKDTRNILEAFHWHLPDSYWIKRCNPGLLFEIADLRASGKPVDWATFCLGIEELLVDPNWFCNSGLGRRRVVLDFVATLQRYMHWIMFDEEWRGKYLANHSGEAADWGWCHGLGGGGGGRARVNVGAD